MGKRENQGQDNIQGWEKEKTQGSVENKGGNYITSPNSNPGVSIRQLRVLQKLRAPFEILDALYQSYDTFRAVQGNRLVSLHIWLFVKESVYVKDLIKKMCLKPCLTLRQNRN